MHLKKGLKLFVPLKRSYVYYRLKSTLASIQQIGSNNNNSSLEKALPFSAVPLVPTIPILKSMWVFLPVIGNTNFPIYLKFKLS